MDTAVTKKFAISFNFCLILVVILFQSTQFLHWTSTYSYSSSSSSIQPVGPFQTIYPTKPFTGETDYASPSFDTFVANLHSFDLEPKSLRSGMTLGLRLIQYSALYLHGLCPYYYPEDECSLDSDVCFSLQSLDLLRKTCSVHIQHQYSVPSSRYWKYSKRKRWRRRGKRKGKVSLFQPIPVIVSIQDT